MSDTPREFQLIARYFRPLAGPGGLGLTDDAALLTPPPGRQLVLTADAMVEDVHFPSTQSADLTARKLLRVNLSDLAAKGATPIGYLLTMAIRRETPESWIADFTAGLRQDQDQFGIVLLGGDSTSIGGPACLSVTMIGHVEPGQAVRRHGARAGDGIWVTGTIGDGALGLAVAQGRLPGDADGWLLNRYRLPSPRFDIGLLSFASACLDISDGLVQDLGHLCRAGVVGAVIEAASVPLSSAARAAGLAWRNICLTGGDDYELLMAVPDEKESVLRAVAQRSGVKLTRIGTFTDTPGKILVRDEGGNDIRLDRHGWSHF
jgi:thiamine-monophosphate kinase